MMVSNSAIKPSFFTVWLLVIAHAGLDGPVLQDSQD
jgi:hypothetical protein